MEKLPRGIRKSIERLSKECQEMGLSAPEGDIYTVDAPVGGFEVLKFQMFAALTKKQPRIDRIWYGSVKLGSTPAAVALPFFGNTAMATEFSIVLNAPCASPMILKRGAMGDWSSGAWIAGALNSPAAQTLAAALSEGVDTTKIDWDHEITQRLKIKLGWAIQLIPGEGNQSYLIMQTALVGAFRQRPGLKAFRKIVGEVQNVLRANATLPADQYPAWQTLIPTELERVQAVAHQQG